MTRFPLLLLSILLSLVSLSLLDFERALVLRVEGVVERFHSPVTYRHLGDGVFEFTDTLSGNTFRKQVTDVKPQGGKQPKKIITIEVAQIDTTGFGSKFTKVASIPAGVQNIVPIGFHAKDGTVHFVAAKFMNGTYASTDFYRWDDSKDTLTAVQRLNGEWLYPFAHGTFFRANMPNVAVDSFGTVLIYDTPDGSNLPTRKRAVRYGRNETAQRPRVYDFDGNGVDEVVLRQWPSRNVVTKLRLMENTFIDVYENTFENRFEYGSWAVGDFDKDGKCEFATVTYGGFVYFVEYNPLNSSYSVVFIDTTRSVNAGFNYEGNDLDRDGHAEVFIGSSFFGGLANIAVYETIGDNDYEVSLWIEINGIGTFSQGIVTGDVNGDGKDELIVHGGGVVIVLEATADDQYQAMWIKAFPNEIGVKCFDTNKDGRQELIISQQRFEALASFTEIYSFSTPLEVGEIRSEFSVNVFPNPAHSDGIILLSGEHPQDVTIRIFDSVGRIVEEYHQRRFTGLLSLSIGKFNLPTGIHFMQVVTRFQTIMKKIVIL